MEDYLLECSRAVLEGDQESAARLAEQAVASDYPLLDVIERGFSAGVREAGKLWEAGEYFLPELAFSAEAMKAAMAILQPRLLAEGGERSRGRVLMGTVQGDIHDIGKSLVSTMFLANNYEVIDLGADVPLERFADEVEAQTPDILGMSALLTTTMAGQQRVVELLRERGLREQVKVLVGGAPASAQWAQDIGADGFGENAIAAVAAADALMEG